MRWKISLILILLSCSLKAENIGVIVMAHGGGERWNQAVTDAVNGAELEQPVELFFGMGMFQKEGKVLQSAVDRLEAKGVDRLLAVPLLISSHSLVYRQYAYLLGISSEPAFTAQHGKSHHSYGKEGSSHSSGHPHEILEEAVTFQVPVTIGNPLGHDARVAAVVRERVAALSQEPARESVILVAHGPVSDQDNRDWDDILDSISADIRKEGLFQSVRAVSLRDDAPPPVRDAATKLLRQMVRQASRRGEVLVVPLLVAPEGIESGIRKRLDGLPYKMAPPLLPHAQISLWIRHQVESFSRL